MEEAKEIARKINMSSERKRLEEKRNKVSERLREEDKIECEFLPPLLTQKFETDVLLKRFSDDDEDKLKASKLLSHWRAVKRIVRVVKLDPSDWSEQPEVIYGQFRKMMASPAYVQKLTRLMNFWGHFICKKQATAFLPLEFPRGNQRQKIATSYEFWTQRSNQIVIFSCHDLPTHRLTNELLVKGHSSGLLCVNQYF